MKERQDRGTVFVDADNTLWDTNAVFAEAQLALLEGVEAAASKRAQVDDRLAYVRAIDQAIAESHHAGLRYPPRLLVRAIELALSGATADSAARGAWRGGQSYALSDKHAIDIEKSFFGKLATHPKIRPGVFDGLTALRQEGCFLLIITEANKAKVARHAEIMNIAQFFNRIIEGRKTSELYRRVLSLTGAPAHAFMVGDQLDRDIAPAKAAGLETIYFPGGFRPRWTPNDTSVRPDHVVASFAEVPSIIIGAARKPAVRAASA